MAITLAPLVYVRSRKSRGHLGDRVEYVVSVKTDALEFYPVQYQTYESPTFGSLDSARMWAKAVGEALGLDVIEELN